jgi:hypothetical protein
MKLDLTSDFRVPRYRTHNRRRPAEDELKLPFQTADEPPGMRFRRISPGFAPAALAQTRAKARYRRAIALVLALGSLLVAGCLMPNRGTPVFVDVSSGDYWSGEGLLLEVSDDQLRCLVAVRDRALIVRERWVPCTAVHSRRTR